MATTLKFFGYVRVSRTGGRKGKSNYRSKDDQVREIHAIAAREGIPAPSVEIVIDEDRSGGNVDRPGFQRVLREIEAGAAAGMICSKLDRFSRDVLDILQLHRDLVEERGARVLLPDGDLKRDLTTIILAAVSEDERKKKGAEMAQQVRNAIGRGAHISIPYGYERSAGKGSPLAIYEPEAAVIRRIYALKIAGTPHSEIARLLNDAGTLPRPRRYAEKTVQVTWRAKSIFRLIRHGEVYTGVAFWGKERVEDAHPAIVSRKDWEQANAIRAPKAEASGEAYLLTGIVRCGSCGYAMVHNGSANRQGKDYRYYVCKAHGGLGCPAKARVRADEIEALVDDAFVEDFLDDELTGVITDAEVITARAGVEDAEERFAAAFAAKADLPKSSSAKVAAVVEQDLVRRQADLEAAEVAYANARAAARRADLPRDENEDTYRDRPVEQRRHLLGQLYAAVVVWPALARSETTASRVRIVTVDEATADGAILDRQTLIDLVAGLDRSPLGSGVVGGQQVTVAA